MRKIGYARVSSTSQNLDRQIAALRAEQVDVIFREKASGKDVKNRPQLEKALDELGTGDVFVVAEWDRATRSMSDGIAIIDRVFRRSAGIKVLDRKYLNLTEDDPVSRGVLALLSALAEDKRRRIHKRANEGRVEAKKAGKRLGRSRSSPTTSRRRRGSAWPPAKRAEPSPATWAFTTAPSAGWAATASRCFARCLETQGAPRGSHRARHLCGVGIFAECYFRASRSRPQRSTGRARARMSSTAFIMGARPAPQRRTQRCAEAAVRP